MPEEIQVRTPADHEFAGVLELRYQVLDQPKDLPRKGVPGSADLHPEAIHVAAFSGTQVVGTVRLDPHPDTSEYLVRSMATLPELQGRGIGARVLRLAESIAAENGAHRIVLHSRPSAVGFYQRLGYVANGIIEEHKGEWDPGMEKTI
jgi:ribosomal protein S18 acetylase RimI-like enzyme